jgi:anhydro-N-acetylmuramic acid kinase
LASHPGAEAPSGLFEALKQPAQGAESGPAMYIGLMSGTSLDGVDAVLVSEDGAGRLQGQWHVHQALPSTLRGELLALNAPGANELHRAALAANGVARLYAAAVEVLLQRSGARRQAIRALGAHGQTVRHRPGEFDATGYTLQLLNGALLAELTGIDVICDFRSRDVAAGGQGAPLVPAFHAAVFGKPGESMAVLNLGGIANISCIGADGHVSGFDCGPGNVLMDSWAARHLGSPYDADGALAARGQVLPRLLAACMAEPFLQRSPPKSTGRDLFSADWLGPRLAAGGAAAAAPADVMATLAEFTAAAAADALLRHAPDARHLVVCGGGAHNRHLMQRLAARSGRPVQSSQALGVPPEQVEAMAFAWLARAFGRHEPGNRAAVTGAAGPRVLGALYPAA